MLVCCWASVADGGLAVNYWDQGCRGQDSVLLTMQDCFTTHTNYAIVLSSLYSNMQCVFGASSNMIPFTFYLGTTIGFNYDTYITTIRIKYRR